MEKFTGISIFAVALAVVVLLYRVHRAALYNPPASGLRQGAGDTADSWRWRKPEDGLNLRLEDAADRSRLYLPHRLGGFEVGAALIGWAIVALFFYGAFMLAWQGKLDWPWVLFNGALTLSTAGALLHAKIHLEAIELRSDQVRFVVRYGIFLRRAVRYRRQGLHFEGDYQSLFSMDTYQSGPDFKISVNRHCFFCMTGKRPFYLLCDEVQGGWIIEGLNAWARAP